MRMGMHIDTEGILSNLIAAPDLIGQSIAVLGIKGSGKSNTASVLMEELLAAGVPICVLDIAGEYYTLKDEHPGLTIVGRSINTAVDVGLTMENIEKVARMAYLNGSSVVFDISGYDSTVREEIITFYFWEIWKQSAVARIPLIIFLEEAHNWLPQGGKIGTKKVFVDIASEGRKRGLSLVLIGQRSTRIDKDTLTQADILFLHKVKHPVDVKVYQGLIPRAPRWVHERVDGLRQGEALVLFEDRVLRCKMRRRHTEHVGATPTLDNLPARQLSLLDLLNEGGNNVGQSVS